MKPDAKLRAALDGAWNEMREQRVLGRIVEARRQRERRRHRIAGAAVAAACAIVAVFVTLRVATRGTGTALRAAETSPMGAASHITLADGSEAVLAPDGDVHIEEQTTTMVHLRQRSGGVRYVVQPNPSREFIVFAEGIAVRVRGTIFSVSVHSEAVEVGVERGRVEIDDGSRKRDIVAGEALSVPFRHAADDRAPDNAAVGAPAGSVPVEPSAAAIAPAAPVSSTLPPASALLARADAARASGHLTEAAQALAAFVATYPHERRVPAAFFTLGRVERARGRLEAAASAFERCAEAMPGGPLADDALAEAAQSWDVAGNEDRALADARADLAAYPGGLHATAMRAFVAK